MKRTNFPNPPRTGIAGGRHVVPAQMSAPERDELARSLYAVHSQIFSGVSFEHFRDHVVDPPAETTVIQLYLSADGRLVGYCAIHRFRRRVKGRDALVLRAEAGLLPACRGRGVTYGFGIIRAATEKLRHPFTPVYYLGTLVHTSSYHLLYKYFPRLFPRPDREANEVQKAIARELIESFPDPAVTVSDPFVRDVGWVTIETPQERMLNEKKDRHDVEFFKHRNPGYRQGHGLVVVAPMTFANIFTALAIRLYERAYLAFTRRQPDL